MLLLELAKKKEIMNNSKMFVLAVLCLMQSWSVEMHGLYIEATVEDERELIKTQVLVVSPLQPLLGMRNNAYNELVASAGSDRNGYKRAHYSGYFFSDALLPNCPVRVWWQPPFLSEEMTLEELLLKISGDAQKREIIEKVSTHEHLRRRMFTYRPNEDGLVNQPGILRTRYNPAQIIAYIALVKAQKK